MVLESSAARAGDRLQALFQIRLPKIAQGSQGAPTPVLYAVGPLDASGNLQPHADTRVRTLFYFFLLLFVFTPG